MPENRILVVDDDDQILSLTRNLLRKYGYQCDTASSVAAAVEMLERQSYDLLISDIHMPGNCDLEFIKDRQRSGQSMPVILMTGFPEVNSAIESIQIGVAAYLVKPYTANQLIEKTQIALQGLQVRRLIHDQNERLREWLRNLLDLDQLSGTSSGKLAIPVDSFIDLTFSNIVGLVSDLKRLTEAAMHHQTMATACHLLNCPRGNSLHQALMETIDVLERTKGSFKSKDLGVLRRKLEILVKGQDSITPAATG